MLACKVCDVGICIATMLGSQLHCTSGASIRLQATHRDPSSIVSLRRPEYPSMSLSIPDNIPSMSAAAMANKCQPLSLQLSRQLRLVSLAAHEAGASFPLERSTHCMELLPLRMAKCGLIFDNLQHPPVLSEINFRKAASASRPLEVAQYFISSANSSLEIHRAPSLDEQSQSAQDSQAFER